MKKLIISCALFAAIGVMVGLPARHSYAVDCSGQECLLLGSQGGKEAKPCYDERDPEQHPIDCTKDADGNLQPGVATNDSGLSVRKIVNLLLFAVGALAVVMVMVSGLKYMLSAGDKDKVVKARKTFTYAIVGLIVALLSVTIVNFVILTLGGK